MGISIDTLWKNEKIILILEDRYELRDREINLGDRALYTSLHRLIEDSINYKIIMGGVKLFPYFNIRHFNSEFSYSDIEKTFNKWYLKVINTSRKRAKYEKKLIEVIEKSFVFNNSFFKKIDNKIKEKFTRGILDTIKPYIFKHYYSQQLIKKLRQSDIVVVNGGGLVADHLKLYLPMLMFEIFLAKKLNKRVAVVNQTVAIKDELNFKLVSFVYRKVDLHMVREPISKKVLIKMGIPSNKIIVSCDTVFANNKFSKETIKKLVSKENLQEGDVAIVIRGDRPVNFSLWINVIKFIQEKYNNRVFFIFTCKSHDFKVYRILSKKCELHLLSQNYNYQTLIPIMSHFDFVITDRYHCAIFCILANTPVIPVESTTFKMKGIFEMIDYPIKVIDMKDIPNLMKESIVFIMKNKRNLKSKLTRVRNYLAKKVQSDIKVLSSI